MSMLPQVQEKTNFCEFKGNNILTMIDAFSKYIWAHLMNTDTNTLNILAVLY